MTEDATPGRRKCPDVRARSGGLILDMLARRIPLTLLPDLAWPHALEDETTAEGSSCAAGAARGPRHARHGGGPGRQETLQQALAFAACPTGRHRRDAVGCPGLGLPDMTGLPRPR